ncbi:MAG: hypothetical protein J5819_08980 [Eubacterium sp.]|nr:hypothetical protein [Eubacterium sp.]
MNDNSRRTHNNVYVFGTAARKYDTMPDFNEHEGRHVNREPRVIERPKTHRKPDFLAIGLIVLTFVAVMVTGIIYLNLNFQSTYLSKSVVKLESEVVELQKNNAATAEQLEDGVNLKEIYKRATKVLGMKPVKKSQIVIFTRKNSTEIHQYGDIPSN